MELDVHFKLRVSTLRTVWLCRGHKWWGSSAWEVLKSGCREAGGDEWARNMLITVEGRVEAPYKGLKPIALAGILLHQLALVLGCSVSLFYLVQWGSLDKSRACLKYGPSPSVPFVLEKGN